MSPSSRTLSLLADQVDVKLRVGYIGFFVDLTSFLNKRREMTKKYNHKNEKNDPIHDNNNNDKFTINTNVFDLTLSPRQVYCDKIGGEGCGLMSVICLSYTLSDF